MHIKSKKTSTIILAITAIACSKAFFFLINDPEGPNLLIVAVATMAVYFLSTMATSFLHPGAGKKKLLLTIAIQVVLVAVAYYFLG